MGPTRLRLVFRLIALPVKHLTDWVSVGGLQAYVFLRPNEELVFVGQVEVKAACEQILMGQLADAGTITGRARLRNTEPANGICQCTATHSRCKNRRCLGTWLIVPQIERLVVERNRGAQA